MRQGRGKQLMLIKNLLLIFAGIAGGFSIAGGVFAFIVMIGVLPRLAGRTHTGWAYWGYEGAVIIGGIIGNILSIFSVSVPIGYVGLIIFGIFAGMYVGCFSMALAEVLNVMPIFSRRIRLRQGMAVIIASLAIGKGIGTWYQLCFPIWQSFK